MLKPLPTETDQLIALEELLVRKLLQLEAQLQWQSGAIADIHLKKYAEILKDLSKNYITANHVINRSKDEALAYALYLTPINFVKVLRALQVIDLVDQGAEPTPFRLLDFGCGPGTATLAALASNPQISEVLAIDHSSEMRALADHLLPHNVVVANSLAAASGKYQLIICANSLNEMEDDQAQLVLQRLSQLLAGDGHLVILEPAQKFIAQKAASLRNWLLQNSDLKIQYPCTRQDDCPMQDHWCHTEMDWQPPRLIKQLDKLTGFNKHRLKTCVFVFSYQGNSQNSLRVVNFPKKLKNGVHLTLCGKDYYNSLVVPKSVGKKLKNYDLVDRSLIEL